jgi:uncharacterized protein with beta-barrel porin domain
LMNSGAVTGGDGGIGSGADVFPGIGGAGGVGILFAGNVATLVNFGIVTGGAGGSGGLGFHGGPGGAGGTGTSFAGTGAIFANFGTVSGGAGGNGGVSKIVGGGAAGVGGAGATFSGIGAIFINSGTVTGGVGGRANAGTGGIGGEGASFTKGGAIFTNSGSVTGGAGGGALVAGSGSMAGSGGTGMSFTGTSATLLNSGAVTGGAGGVGIVDEFGNRAAAGTGGVGIVGTGLTIINSGTIRGGLSGDGKTRANAITFTGNNNILEVRSGSEVIGNVVGAGSDTFRLGGAVNGSFDVSSVGSQYRGFNEFQKSGASTWTLTGSTIALMPWTINRGVLSVAADTSLGAVTGGLTFNGGTLQFGAGFNLSNTRAITLEAGGGAIDTNGFSTSIGSPISGMGSLTKLGLGAVTVSSVNTYTGQTNIDHGALIVDGSIARSSLTNVNNGGTLSGVGTVGNLVVNNGGVFAPGKVGAAGTMTVAGNLTFNSESFYNIAITNLSSADVTGTAKLAGTVNVSFGSGTYLQKAYSILHADGGLGNTKFSNTNLIGVLPNFRETLSYTSTDVFLGLTSALGEGSPMPGNQRGVAAALDTAFNSGAVLPPSFVQLYGLTGSNLSNALASLSGETATGMQQVAFRSMSQFLDVITDPTLSGRNESTGTLIPALAFAPERPILPASAADALARVARTTGPTSGKPLWSSWASGFGGYNRIVGDPIGTGTHDLSSRIAGIASGFDYSPSPDAILGLAVAGGGTNWGLSQGSGTGRSDFFQAGTYASLHWGPAYLSSAFGFANHWASTARVAGFGDHFAGSFEGQSYGGRAEAGFRLVVPDGFAPYAAVQAQGFVMPTYSETGQSGSFSLSYNGRTATDTRIEIGTRFDHAMVLDVDRTLALRARLAFAHDRVSNPTLAAVFQTLPGAGFFVVGAKPVTNIALVSGGIELRLAEGWMIGAKFDGEFASRASLYAGTGILKLSW